MTRVLFIRFSSIGDLILTAPAVAAFRNAVHGDVEVHFLTKSAFQPVVDGFGDLIDEIHTVDRSGAEALPTLQGLGFSHVIDLQGNVRSRSVTRGLGLTSTFRVDKRNAAKWALVNGWRSEPISPIVDRYIASFSGAFAGTEVPAFWPALFTDAQLPPGFDGKQPWSVIALGAAHAGKAMELEMWRIVLIGGESETARALDLDAESWVGSTSIAQSAAILRGAQAVIAGDTGMMHLAAALGCRVVTVWGCTRPSLGMGAWRAATGSVDVLPEGRGEQRPCSKLGDRCRFKGPSTCSAHVDTNAVLEAWEAANGY
jgi:ADP-heptose:LPS heptosyltransferase